MAFNPKIIFHRADTGAAVSITIDNSKLNQLQIDSSLTLAFNYEDVDVDDQGQVVYVPENVVRSELSQAIGSSSTFNRPTIITPVGNGAMFTGTLRASAFTTRGSSGVTHTSTTWYVSHDKNFNNTLGTNKEVTVSNGDLTTNNQWSQGSLDNPTTPYIYVKVKYTASDGTSSYSLPMQFTTRVVTKSAPSPIRSRRSIDSDISTLSLEEQMEQLQSTVEGFRSNKGSSSESLEVEDAYQYGVTLDFTSDSLSSDGKFSSNDVSSGIRLRLSALNQDSTDMVISKFKSIKLDILNVQVPDGMSEELFLSSLEYNKGFRFINKDGDLVSTITFNKDDENIKTSELLKGIFINNINVGKDQNVTYFNIRAKVSLEGEEDQTLFISVPVSLNKEIKYIEGDIITPYEFGIKGFRNLAKFIGEVPSEAVSAQWSLKVGDIDNVDILSTKPIWSAIVTESMNSIGVYSGESIVKPSEFRDSSLYQNLMLHFDNFKMEYDGSDLSDYEKGLPIHSIDVFKALFNSNEDLIVEILWKNKDGDIIGYCYNTVDDIEFSKYDGLERNDLFVNTIYKLPYLSKNKVSDSGIYLADRYYIEPCNKSLTVLNPLGHSESTIQELASEQDSNVLDIMMTSPYTLSCDSSNNDFNYIVFNSVNHLADMIYSMSFYSALPKEDISDEDSFTKYSKSLMFRRPITIHVGNASYDFINFSSFDLGREEIINFLNENNITPEYFKENPNANRRLHVSVYSGVNIPGYPLYMESVLVAFKDEIEGIKEGNDGYLKKPKDIERVAKFLDYDKDLESFNYSESSGILNTSKMLSNYVPSTLGSRIRSISYLPNALKLFKSNFEFYGTIPFWLCTDRSVLGHKGTFVHRVEGYKEGQEVVHPVDGSLYVCKKDRPGTKETLTKSNFKSVEHTYGITEPSYSVLEDTEYFEKVCSGDNRYRMENSVYRKYYKSSLPTYLSLLSYLNLLVNSKEGLMFNPYNSQYAELTTGNDRVFDYKDDATVSYFKEGLEEVVDKSLFPYKYLEDYIKAMESNKDKFEFTDDMKTSASEMKAAEEDDLFGAWFKLKNLNTHNFFYMSTRPVIWVKDRRTIARANIAHPRNTVIRVGLKFYYLRLVTDQFFPNDDCCMESNIISSIPNQTLDFTTFNDPSPVNFKESLIGPTIRNILHMATGKTEVTDRNLLEGNKEIYKFSITKNKENTNFFSRRGTLLYSASPYKFYMGDGERVLNCHQDDKILSVLTYNLHDSIPDFEYGSSESKLGLNEIVFKDPVDISKFVYRSENDKLVSGLDFDSELNSSKTMTGIYLDEEYSSYNTNLNYVSYNNVSDREKPFEDYYPVYFVLEEVDEKDLPIYNIKNSLQDFVNEKESKSIVNKLEDLSFKADKSVSEIIKTSDDVDLFKTFTKRLLTPVYSRTNNIVNVPFITNGGYGLDRVKDIDYNLKSEKVIDIINYNPIEGTTPDTMFNTTPEEMYDAQDRRTYGTVNIDDVKEGNFGHYSVVNSTTADRELKVRSYDRWTMSGYLGTIDVNNTNTKNILFPQLEKILKHRLVNNDSVRRNEKELYPLIHVYYFNTKLYLVPSSSPFDLYEENRYGFKFTQEMEHVEIGRTKPIDSLSKDVSRVKLGANVFDVVIPYVTNDKNIRSNQELNRNIIVTEAYKEIK